MKHLRGEVADGLVVIAVAACLTICALGIDMDLWDGEGVSPRFFPVLLAGIIAVLGVLIIVRSLVAGDHDGEKPPIARFAVHLGRTAVSLSPPVVLVVAMTLMLVLVKPLGFPLVAAVVMFCLLQILRVQKRTRQNAVIAVLVSVTIFLVFHHGFRVYLPIGFGL